MFGEVQSATMIGLDCKMIRVEADIADGLPMFEMVGYLAGEVREARERVRAAMRNCGLALPARKVTVNLSPGDVRKAGASFDLPIAVALLLAAGFFSKKTAEILRKTLILGELGLNGEVQRVNGVLPITAAIDQNQISCCIVPADNALEGAAAASVPCYGVRSLRETVDFLLGKTELRAQGSDWETEHLTQREDDAPDFQDIAGQEGVKRAAQIAAAGFHNLLMIGPPGVGKTMIARSIPGILPPMSDRERLILSKIYSIAGLLPPDVPLLAKRPFRAPHHQVTGVALIGGGTIPRPGEVTLAHRGVLFLDELSEFSRTALEMLRQPLEEREVALARLGGRYVYPADFMLVAAMNPCACGYYPDRTRCVCGRREIQRHINKISQALLDRMDLCVEIPRVAYERLAHRDKGQCSAEIRRRVEEAVLAQEKRYEGTPFRFNADLTAAAVEQFCPLTEQVQDLLEKAFRRLDLSARAYHRLIRVARTIADLDQSERIQTAHMAEAIAYRNINKTYWR
ncbi:MAG: YifB family Mg chelatase-like AAA ATPase [Lachnospiraceae bacterium]